MFTPTSALAWEIWRKNRTHIIGIVCVLLFFILAYPMLCVFVGFNPNSADAADEFAHRMAANLGHRNWADVARMIGLLVLAGGPLAAMVLTLVYVTWMFTFTEANAKTKDPMAFSAHVFNLPISTPGLFWRLVLGGALAVLGLFSVWVHCVHLPHFAIFDAFDNGCLWVILLILAQAVVWSLAAWPIFRTLALLAVSWLVVVQLAETALITSPLIFVPLIAIGLALGYAGLAKMRHGQWQGWVWPPSLKLGSTRATLAGPARFSSPARAQLWFEWRRAAIGLVFPTVLLVWVPIVFLLLRARRLDPATMDGLSIYLVGLPPFLFLLFGLSLSGELARGRRDQSFVLVRPLDSGGLFFSQLQVMAISTVLTWGAVLGAFAVLPLLGDFSDVEKSLSPSSGFRVAFMIGLIFMTWRLAVVNFGFGYTGNRWVFMIAGVAPLLFGIGVAVLLNSIEAGAQPGNWVWSHDWEILVTLLAVKCVLACLAFRACLHRRLLTPSATVRYLVIWILLLATLLSTLWWLACPKQDLLIPASLWVVLLMPLARIGLAPVTLARNRHAQ